MTLEVIKHRAGLKRLKAAIEGGRAVIGFVGGSITDGRPRHNWPEPVAAWLVDRYPFARFVIENAAIGATGSDLAVLRAQRDLIDRGCDIVFIEFAVNDNDTPTDRRMRTREGLIRKLLEGGGRDLVFVYTFCHDMYEAMMDGRMPASIAEFEQLADYYGAGSVWVGLHALRQVRRGLMRWEEWLPDGLHPTSRGSYAYAEAVIRYLEDELERQPGDAAWDAARAKALAQPLHPDHWGNAELLPLEAIRTRGPWTIRRWLYHAWIDQVLETAAVGAGFELDFEGRGVALAFDFGKTSAEFRWRIDGGEWRAETRERPDWVGPDGWFRLSVLTESLPPGPHRLELEVMHGSRPDCTGTNFRLALAAAIR